MAVVVAIVVVVFVKNSVGGVGWNVLYPLYAIIPSPLLPDEESTLTIGALG